MTPNPRFTGLSKAFWAHVRSISEHLGYTDRSTAKIKQPTLCQIRASLRDLRLRDSHLVNEKGEATALGTTLTEYLSYRAKVLNDTVEGLLMDAA